MLRKTFVLLIALVLLAGLTGAGEQAAAAQRSQTNPPPEPSRPPSGPSQGPRSRSMPGSSWKLSPDGNWYMTRQPGRGSAALAPQDFGGPDNYGYTWDDTGALSWIDATTGTNTGLSGYTYNKATGPITLPFTFKYYENSYTQLWIAASGYLGFTDTGGYWPDWSYIPSPGEPNNVIAPYWSPYKLASSGKTNRVFYKSGGTAPNRYFVVEWNQVKDVDLQNNYTFEVILYENGNIAFQYQTMSYNSSNGYYCATSGIEDLTGLDGLSYLGYCNTQDSNTAVQFTYPAPSARISISPRASGSFVAPGAVAQFDLTVRNTGSLGTDTYDLFLNSTWPIAVYASDSVTPLGDTNGNGSVDTGPIAQGSFTKIVVKVTTPGTATVGQYDRVALTVQSWLNAAKSRIFSLQVAVPERFAQSYSSSGKPFAGFYRPTAQVTSQTTNDYGYSPVVATTPDGNIVQVWREYRLNGNNKTVEELYYAVLNGQGIILRPPARLTDHSSATLEVYDYNQAVIISPNGKIGITWVQEQYKSSNSTWNDNTYYQVLDAAGGIAVPPTNLTNNTVWDNGSSSETYFYNPAIVTTPDNHFLLAWEREIYTNSDWFDTIWYTVRDAAGSAIKGITQFGTDTCSYDPNLAPLLDGSVILSGDSCGSLWVGRLDSAGNILTGPSTLFSDSYLDYPDAVQLNNGNILLAGTSYYYDTPVIQYAMLDASLNVVKNVTDLDSLSPVGDDNVSVTHYGNQGVLTWGDECCDYQPNLYYALVDGNGELVTSPMIFATDNVNYSMQLPYNGQGNTYLPGANDLTPPISSARSPDFSMGPFQVSWSGTDAGSGIDYYNIWVRDGTGGTWALWQSGTTALSATYTSIAAGHTYYFRSQAVDVVGNVETDLPVDGDTHTMIATYQVSGHVLNLRGEPVFNAAVSAPGALNTAKSDGFGVYTLYFGAANTYDLTASRDGYGTLPPLKSLSVTTNVAGVDFVLPPESDAVNNGGWETGDLTGWQAAAGLTPGVGPSAAHTGDNGLQLDAIAGSSFVSYITQTITVSITGSQPTLSWMVRVLSGSADGEFGVKVSSLSQTVTQTMDLTPGGWRHAWIDLSPFIGQTVTLYFGYQDPIGSEQVYLDEVSLGENQVGSYQVLLPVILR